MIRTLLLGNVKVENCGGAIRAMGRDLIRFSPGSKPGSALLDMEIMGPGKTELWGFVRNGVPNLRKGLLADVTPRVYRILEGCHEWVSLEFLAMNTVQVLGTFHLGDGITTVHLNKQGIFITPCDWMLSGCSFSGFGRAIEFTPTGVNFGAA